MSHAQTDAAFRHLERSAADEALRARARSKFDAARQKVRPFAGDHLDIMAMSYILLAEEKRGHVTPTEVKARARRSYPEAFES